VSIDTAWKPWWTDRLIEKARERRTSEWWQRAAVIDEAEALFPDEGGRFVDYFIGGENGPVAAVPPDFMNQMDTAMMEAKREVGWEMLTEFCIQLVPIVRAIERMGK
jgi:hypothetical protein